MRIALSEPIDSQRNIDLKAICDGVYTSLSMFKADLQTVFDKITGAILPGVTFSNIIDIIFSFTVNGHPLQSSIHHSFICLPASNPTPSSSPSSFHPHFSYIPHFFLLVVKDGTGKSFVMKAIQAYLKLCNKTITALATLAVGGQLLRTGKSVHYTIRRSILRSKS